jgi:hypothetical protein
MAAGVRGRLITATFAETLLHTLPGAATPPPYLSAALDAWGYERDQSIGPASSVRTIVDRVVAPLLRILGFRIAARDDEATRVILMAACGDGSVPTVVVRWDDSLPQAWRATVLGAVRADRRWCFCSNGRTFRIVDAQHTWSREYLEFDLAMLPGDQEAQRVLWALVRAEACAADPPLLDGAVLASARQGLAVCRALGDGVLEALKCLLEAFAKGRATPADAFEHSLTLVYRVLFLLFAEARALVPLWHPVYRDRYTVDSIVTTLLSGRRYRGVSQALTAISKLAHAGCSAGELKVTAFNGRLFAPPMTTVLDRVPIDDRTMERAVLAISTTTAAGSAGRSRIAYRDLDVEQLGAVYEHVLEYEPVASGPALLDRTRDARKSTGTFYTPRAVTDYLVRHTLAALTASRSSADLLGLRILDPAMGSGAFLVAACRHLAHAVEQARICEGVWHPGDVTPAERAMLRREIAVRCLFGVDLNPMAVQLARLSLWLATLAADKPLTFLDHHLIAGNSLIGASIDDICRQPGRVRRGRRACSTLPLFDATGLTPVIEDAVRTRLRLTFEPDDAAAVVHRKEQQLAALGARDAPLRSWARVLDLWCAGWFRDNADGPAAGAFGEICSHILGRPCALPHRTAAALADQADAIAASRRFLHWPLAFPEVFADELGEPRANPGFDAVIGNPPWDMVRGDSGDSNVRSGRRDDARRLTDFVREAGIYQVEPHSHVNRYQLFVERALQLTRLGGRVGLVLPSGVVSDAGSAGLRRHLFDRAAVDSITGLDNRHGIFPIHRSMRFVLLTATMGSPTARIACRFGVSRVEELDSTPEQVGAPLMLTRRLLSRLSGDDDLAVPELTTPLDLAIVEKIAATFPPLGGAEGWRVQFGRELNATDDREAFVPYSGSTRARPVLEGKQIEPFKAFPERSRLEVPSDSAASRRVPRRSRLAYRDVASATNRLTLIAAIIPPHSVTTHTLFCLKTPLPVDSQHVLCALLNSFVANYLVRLRVNTHVTASLLSRLPVPLVSGSDPAFKRLAALSQTLSSAVSPAADTQEYAELQALVARLYALRDEDFTHVLVTFPLVAAEIKSNVLARFHNLH